MEIKLPRLAEGVESGTVVSILVSEGDQIQKDQPIVELETQKAVGSIPSPESGTVTQIHVKQGQEVSVGQVLISLSTGHAADEAPAERPEEEQPDKAPSTAAKAALTPQAPAPPQKKRPTQPQLGRKDYQYESKSGLPPPAAPSIRKIARELGIDLTRVKGSESGGRIVLDDLRAYIQYLQDLAFQEKAPVVQAPTKLPAEKVDFSKWGPVRNERMSSLRLTVGRKMVESWTTIPQINQFDDADITSILSLRKKFGPLYEKKGSHLTITTFLLVAVVRALQKHPRVNSSLDESSGEIVYKNYYHIAVAVDTEAGLIVPVVRDADKKSMAELSRELRELTEKTRQRKISLEELQGGSFTISNQGSIGGSHFTPIVYPPQVAILGVGQGAPKTVVRKKKVEIRTLLPLCLSYDHRVLDGADAVRFLREVITTLENFPEKELKVN